MIPKLLTRGNLKKKVENYFAEIEQLAFSPSHFVPGIGPSEDPVLQSRLFSYPDTHRHRLGVNYQQIPVNRPLHPFNPFQRDGFMAVDGNYGANPNYLASTRELSFKPTQIGEQHTKYAGAALRDIGAVTDDDFEQPLALWNVLGKEEGQQDHYVHNVAGHLSGADEKVRKRTYQMFSRIHQDLGARIEQETEKLAPAPKSQANGSARPRY